MEIQAQFCLIWLQKYTFLGLACSSLPSDMPNHRKSLKSKHSGILEGICLRVGQ